MEQEIDKLSLEHLILWQSKDVFKKCEGMWVYIGQRSHTERSPTHWIWIILFEQTKWVMTEMKYNHWIKKKKYLGPYWYKICRNKRRIRKGKLSLQEWQLITIERMIINFATIMIIIQAKLMNWSKTIGWKPVEK